MSDEYIPVKIPLLKLNKNNDYINEFNKTIIRSSVIKEEFLKENPSTVFMDDLYKIKSKKIQQKILHDLFVYGSAFVEVLKIKKVTPESDK